MDKPPEEPGNVIRLIVEAPRRRAFLAVDVSPEIYAEFAALADEQGKTVEDLLGEAMQHVFDRYGRPKPTATIIRPGFKPQEPQP
jgi:hypothetical protein